jgi:hypothetical protein
MLVSPTRMMVIQSAAGRPSLELDFLSGGALDSRVTFTRASTAWAYDGTGTLTSYATNTPRFDYDPVTLAAKGLLIEEARTNSLTNNSMTGAAAGTPGTLPTSWAAPATAAGITRTIVGAGTVNGLPYVDVRYAGTAVAGDTVLFLNATTGAATVNATTWTATAFLALVGGSLTNVTVKQGLRYRAAAGASILSQIYETAVVPTSTLTRYERAATGSDATIAFVLASLNLTMASGAVDVTIRIAAPQLELGSFATSPILTTTVAVTRAQDVPLLSGLSPWFNATAGTGFAEFMIPSVSATLAHMLFSLDDGTGNERMSLRPNVGTLGLFVFDGGVAQTAPLTDGAVSSAVVTKAAFRYAANDFAICKDGGAVSTDTSGTLPTVTRMTLGYRLTSSDMLNGYLRSVRYWPSRKTDADLQALTV